MSDRLKPVAYAVIFVLLFSILGFRVAHPKSGLRSAAGSASTSLVLYRHTSKFATGDKVVVNFPKKDMSPAVGIIRSVTDRNAQVQADNLVVNIALVDIKGKLFGILPFIGSLFSMIGM